MSGFDDLIKEEEQEVKVKAEKPQSKESIVNHIAFVMDHSGSMSSLSEVSRTNFNEQLAQIRQDTDEQENFVTLIEFDSEVKECCRNKPIDTIKDLDTYWIGGMTALYDATMQAIWGIESDMPKEGNHAALIVIITDGYENASKENGGNEGRKRLKERIEKLQDTGKWTFVFMGADQDVLKTAVADIGIHAGNTISYDASTKGVNEGNASYKMSFQNYRASRNTSVDSGVSWTAPKEFFSGQSE
jgi:Mg-chelatase subunit ChlD